MYNMFDIGDTVAKKSEKPFKGGDKLDIIESFQVNEHSPQKELGAYLKNSKTIVSLRNLIIINKINCIYLISSDGHRDSINLNVFFKHDDIDSIQKYVENYYKYYFNLEINMLTVDYQNELISFYVKDINDSDDLWEKCSMHLHKIKNFNV